MSNCPICHSALEEKLRSCPSCNAKKAYIKIENLVLGKSAFIVLGIIMPVLIALLAISAQTLFGIVVSITMIAPLLYTIWRLIQGPKWFG